MDAKFISRIEEAWTNGCFMDRQRVLSMPFGLAYSLKTIQIHITFGLLLDVDGSVSLVSAAGGFWLCKGAWGKGKRYNKTKSGKWYWKGEWDWKWYKPKWYWAGWNFTWTPISGCHIRICDQRGETLAEIPLWALEPKAMIMKDKLIKDGKDVVPTSSDDDDSDGHGDGTWAVVDNIECMNARIQMRAEQPRSK
jgi:hypothetical protein